MFKIPGVLLWKKSFLINHSLILSSLRCIGLTHVINFMLLSQNPSKPSYYRDDQMLPIFQEGKKEWYTPLKAMEILLDKDIDNAPKCSKVPLRVRSNKAFLMDTTKFKQWEDIKSVMNGSFPQILRTSTWTVEKEGYPSLFCKVISKKCEELKWEGQYHVKFSSKKNHAGLCRSIVLLTDVAGAVVNNVCLLQYHITTGEDNVNFEVKSHSAAKKQTFFPCEKSLLNTLKERVTKEPARTVYEDEKKKAGRPSKAENIGQLPRSRQQVYNLSQLPRSRQQVYNLSHLHKLSTDPVDELLKYAKETEERIVISHHHFPEDLWILGTDQMCKDLTRFCTSELLCYPLSVDPTFSFGKYEVTAFCYRRLFLKCKRTQAPPPPPPPFISALQQCITQRQKQHTRKLETRLHWLLRVLRKRQKAS